MGKYFDYPETSLGIQAEDIAKPILLFQAARAAKRKADLEQAMYQEQQRHAFETESVARQRAASDEFRANEAHRAAMENERLKGEEMRRKQALDLASGLPQVNEYLNPTGTKYNPGVGQAVAGALGIQGLRQVTPQRPEVPNLANPPAGLRQVLSRGTALAGLEQGEIDGNLPGFDRPPTEAEFQRYAGRPGQGPLGPEQYGEGGEIGPLAQGESRENLLAQGRARQAFRNPEYQTAARDYLGQRQSALADLETYDQRLAESQRSPTYEGTSQFGPISLEPVRQEEAIERRHGEAAQRINELASQPGVDPYTANEIRIVARKVAQRMVTPEEANKDLNFIFQQRMGVEKAKEMAKAGASRGDVFREGNVIKEKQLFNQQFQQLLGNFGWKGDVAGLKSIADARAKFGSDNAALQTMAGADFAKKANGAGVLTDKDYERYWLKMGGVGAAPWSSIDDAVNYIWSGKVSAEKRRIVIEAMDEDLRRQTQRLTMARDQADAWAAAQSPDKQAWYAPLRAGTLGWLPERQTATTPQQSAAQAGPSAQDRKVLEWYRSPASQKDPRRSQVEAQLKAKGLL